MTLGELKKSVRKLSSDFDDIHVMVHVLNDDGKPVYDLLTFTSYTTDFSAIVLGGWSVAKKLAKEGKLSEEQTEFILKLAKEDEIKQQQVKKKKKNDDTDQDKKKGR